MLDELRRFRGFVKGGVGHDDERVGVQTWAYPPLPPGVEDRRIAGVFEQTGRGTSPIHASGNARGAGASMSGNQAIDALAFRRVSITPHRRRRKPAFSDVAGLFAASQKPFAKPEEPSSSERVAVLVAHPFFYA